MLIGRLLAGAALAIMVKAARRYGVEALVEVHDEEDLDRAIDAESVLFVVNNHDPGTTRMDPGAGIRLSSKIPQGAVKVARGGINSHAEVDRLSAAGYDALFVGGQLMRAADPADALWALLQPAS